VVVRSKTHAAYYSLNIKVYLETVLIQLEKQKLVEKPRSRSSVTGIYTGQWH